MKKVLIISIVLVSVLLLSCKKTEHNIRVKNTYSVACNIVIGPTTFNNVTTNSTTDYQSISTGDHSVTITPVSGNYTPSTGTLSLTEKGKHNWTFTVTNEGKFSTVEDK